MQTQPNALSTLRFVSGKSVPGTNTLETSISTSTFARVHLTSFWKIILPIKVFFAEEKDMFSFASTKRWLLQASPAFQGVVSYLSPHTGDLTKMLSGVPGNKPYGFVIGLFASQSCFLKYQLITDHRMI